MTGWQGWGRDEAPVPGAEARVRRRLAREAIATVARPSANVAVALVRALDPDLEPPRALWADVVLAASAGGARVLVLERRDDGADRLLALDLAPAEPHALARLTDDAWVRETALALVLGGG